ncbi:MAG TPA: type II secretion system F family protein [Bacteroidetes bacterium]|nr:type II secretion system F family protein [Bacteroidota bacterium]
MPNFYYRAINNFGQIVEDVLEAPNLGVVTERLDNWGLTPLQIREHKPIQSSFLKKLNEKKIKSDEIVLFTKQLTTLLKAGVPLLSALEALVEQASNSKLRSIIQDIYISVESGNSFSDALDKHRDVFPKLYASSVRAGEMSGSLDEVLERMATMLTYEKETRDKIKSAMRYPIIVVCALVLAFVILILMVIPKFAAMFQQLGATLPLPTRVLIAINDLFQNYGIFIFSAVVVLFLAFKRYTKTPKGHFQWDKIKLRLPLFGPLILKNSLSRFAKMFETLNRSGLPILETLGIVAETVGNLAVGEEIRKISLGVQKGEGLARPLRRSELFPPMVVRMIAIGEQSGSLDSMLENISRHYDIEVDYAIKKMTSMINLY